MVPKIRSSEGPNIFDIWLANDLEGRSPKRPAAKDGAGTFERLGDPKAEAIGLARRGIAAVDDAVTHFRPYRFHEGTLARTNALYQALHLAADRIDPIDPGLALAMRTVANRAVDFSGQPSFDTSSARNLQHLRRPVSPARYQAAEATLKEALDDTKKVYSDRLERLTKPDSLKVTLWKQAGVLESAHDRARADHFGPALARMLANVATRSADSLEEHAPEAAQKLRGAALRTDGMKSRPAIADLSTTILEVVAELEARVRLLAA